MRLPRARSPELRDTGGMRHSPVFAWVFWASLLGSRPLRAESARVILVRPSTPSAIVTETLTRIRGELVADGFDVSIVEAPEGSDPASVLVRVDKPSCAAAALGLNLHADASAADLLFIDR